MQLFQTEYIQGDQKFSVGPIQVKFLCEASESGTGFRSSTSVLPLAVPFR
jgi:hypothetical protein